jgi:hypothetical protein
VDAKVAVDDAYAAAAIIGSSFTPGSETIVELVHL